MTERGREPSLNEAALNELAARLPPAPLRVGLTGGIASGKTTVANRFASAGASVIDSDVIARQVVAQGGPAWQAVRDEFGPHIFDKSDNLDRSSLRTLIFAEPGARDRLEAILHPAIAEEMLARSLADSGPYQIWVVPLLLETGFDRLVMRVLVVDCPRDAQITRLVSRDGGTVEQAQRILAAQLDRDQRLEFAHDVIRNDRDLAALEAQVDQLHQVYLEWTPQLIA